MLNVFGVEIRADSGWNSIVLKTVRAAAKEANPIIRYDDLADTQPGIDCLKRFCKDSGLKWVRGEFLIKLHRDHTIMPRQQDLPQSGITTLEDWCDFDKELDRPRPLVVSHPWWTKQHPDPEGHQLAEVYRHLKKEAKENGERPVFIDYCCLPQRVLGPSSEVIAERTPKEWNRFKTCLRNIHIIYTHDYTQVFRIRSEMPVHLVARLGKRFTINSTPLDKRGWCEFETRIASMKTLLTDNLSATDAVQTTPLTPKEYAKRMQDFHFSNDGIDRDLVVELYHRVFDTRIYFVREIAECDLSALEVCRIVRMLPQYVNLEHFQLIACDLNADALTLIANCMKTGHTAWPQRCKKLTVYTDDCTHMENSADAKLMQHMKTARTMGGTEAGKHLQETAKATGATVVVRWLSELSGGGTPRSPRMSKFLNDQKQGQQ